NTNQTTPIKLKSIESFRLESEQCSNLCHSHSKYESNDTSQAKIHQAARMGACLRENGLKPYLSNEPIIVLLPGIGPTLGILAQIYIPLPLLRYIGG
ncbi:hypothetical protein SFRURICE_017531, partial [Spodoptera frugiperda]